jgi:selenide,water dikinase
MATLNKKASELMQAVGVNACTDITGFGLLGHACQVAENSGVAIKLHHASVPYFPEVAKFVQKGLCPGGLYRNKEFYSTKVKFAAGVPEYMQDILFDAQTSGGLLISLAPEAAQGLLDKLHKANVQDAAIIGEVVSRPRGRVLVG